MKALLPVYCRPLGYVVLLVALFIPFILVMQGVVTEKHILKDDNILVIILSLLNVLIK